MNKKKCSKEGCNNVLYARKLCFYHYKIEYYKSSKTRLLNKMTERFDDKLINLYKDLWNKRKHVSWLSELLLNDFVGSRLWHNIFAHVLAKGQNQYPEFKYNEDNIIFLTPYEHHLFDYGTIKQRIKYAEEVKCDWKRLEELSQTLLKQYNDKYKKDGERLVSKQLI